MVRNPKASFYHDEAQLSFIYHQLGMLSDFVLSNENREKTGLWGVRPGPTQTGLYSYKQIARGLKFQNWKVEGLYYPCSKNKGADQLREADLRLCFRICENPVFS